MKEERLEILRMVADGVISIEEAERLLAALAEGKARDEARPMADFGRGFADMGRGFAGMGKTIRSSVRRAMKTAMNSGGLVNSCDVPEGAEIVIEDTEGGGGGDLSLVPAGSTTGRLSWSGICAVKVEAGEVRLQRPGADETVYIPDVARGVRVVTHHGSVRATAVPVPLSVETLDGDLEIVRPGQEFRIETMSGSVTLDLDRVVGESRAATMGGNVAVVLGPGVSTTLRATSLDGDLDIEEGVGRVRTAPATVAPLTAELEVGSLSPAGSLQVETAGGRVSIRRRR